MSSVTKDGIEVKVGQVWERKNGFTTARVLDVDWQFRRGKREVCALMHPEEGLSSYVSVERMSTGKSGWKLIKDSP